ncbi:MAG: [FeFe] hydrogenase H-cluster radical SAM maturase HydG [Candidatus Izemoplasmatales bacterium]
MDNFINQEYINQLVETAALSTKEEIREIIEKGKTLVGLSHVEVAKLLSIVDEDLLSELLQAGNEIKSKIYGNRVVLFAPLYISNYCVNNCAYCGYKKTNKIARRKLSTEEIVNEVKALEKAGHKRIALEAGEDDENCSFDEVLDAIDTIYRSGDIRRINVNIAATSVENYRRLKEKGIGTYILFQETYNEHVYRKMHISGPKSDYERQLFAMHRAMEAGIDDVGGGVLFGLSDYRYEVISLFLHNEALEKQFHVGFHTISVPRLQKAEGVSAEKFKYLVDDFSFKKIVATIRLAVPYTGIIISTRETKEMRELLIDSGVTQLSAGSHTEVGGYQENEKAKKVSQFTLKDERTPIEVIKWLISYGHLPSFCTGCYRKGRTGEVFMETVKAGNINLFCQPNAILSLAEYIQNYGDEELKDIGWDFIQNEVNQIPFEKTKKRLEDNLLKIKEGQKDLYE